MPTSKELGDNNESQIKKYSNFKIGKTGQTIKERYDKEYSDTYDHSKLIGHSESATDIDNFEKYMIDRFKDLPNCDNEQVGGGEMTKSNKYIVYVMYNA